MESARVEANRHSEFYVATQSPWFTELPEFLQNGFRHYVVFGRDGHVELIARGYTWREWAEWPEESVNAAAAIAEGVGVD